MSHTILIVDDSARIRKSLRACVDRSPDWEICGEAENGRDGIARAQELHPDIIVLDLSMPVMNGIEAATALSRLLPTTPVIIFSEYSCVLSDREARSAGISALVSKAEDISVLLNKASALLQ
jgi:DNA-binding NarL/FixJ family response regulator